MFAEEGAKLILLARRKGEIDQLAEELKSKYGTESLTFKCDVRIYDEVEAIVITCLMNGHILISY